MNSSKKILIIDDDSKNIFALNAVLKARKYQCLSALSAKEGLQLLSGNDSIGVVLMDMMMPEMDGYEAIGKMKTDEQLKEIPVIAITAQAQVLDTTLPPSTATETTTSPTTVPSTASSTAAGAGAA